MSSEERLESDEGLRQVYKAGGRKASSRGISSCQGLVYLTNKEHMKQEWKNSRKWGQEEAGSLLRQAFEAIISILLHILREMGRC